MKIEAIFCDICNPSCSLNTENFWSNPEDLGKIGVFQGTWKSATKAGWGHDEENEHVCARCVIKFNELDNMDDTVVGLNELGEALEE
jgi:hypothetical protein